MKNSGNVLVNLISIIAVVIAFGFAALLINDKRIKDDWQKEEQVRTAKECNDTLATPPPVFNCDQWMADYKRQYADGSSAEHPGGINNPYATTTCMQAAQEVEFQAANLERRKSACR